jgi:hypothetical protein
VHIDCKINFHHHVGFLFSRALKSLGLILTITFLFSTAYFAFIGSEFEYASVAWNSVTITNSNKLERIQRKFAALCHNRVFQDVEYHCDWQFCVGRKPAKTNIRM